MTLHASGPINRAMVRHLISALFLLFLAVAAKAEGMRGGDTSGYLLGSRTAPALSFDPSYPSGYPAVAGAWSFHADPDLRHAVTRSVLSGVRGNTPSLAAAIGERPFESFGPALAAHSISDTRLDDALAFMMLALWDAANASDAETTPGQTAAVKRQAQGILSALPGGRPVGVSVQEASDSIWLTALTFSILTSKVLEARNPASVAQLQQVASRESVASFGVDFRNLSLSDAGLLPR